MLPPPPFIFIENVDVLFFSFFEMKCRPGPTGPVGAKPVVSKFLYFALVNFNVMLFTL